MCGSVLWHGKPHFQYTRQTGIRLSSRCLRSEQEDGSVSGCLRVRRNPVSYTHLEVSETARKVAFVRCGGSCSKAKNEYEYYGVEDCNMMIYVPNGGAKICNEGCLGFGSCVKACAFDALHIEDGIAVVDREKCKACGKCITACPQHLIDLVPYEQKTLVKCKCEQKGKAVITGCDAGCISCMKCVKNCPADAITMENNVAKIDFEK